MRQAKIYRKGTLAGMLTEDGGEYTFMYDSAWAELINNSFLSEDMKEAYLGLIDKRIKALS